MPDTLPYPPDLTDGDRAVTAGRAADSGDDATARARIPTLGPKGKRAAGAHAAPITWRLAILVIVAILPVLVFSAYMIVNYSQAQRAIYMQQFQATTRATSLAINSEVARQKAILETLCASAEVKNHDWRGLYDFAKAATAEEPGDVARVNLTEASGQVILTTFSPFDTKLGQTPVPDVIQAVVNTKQPFVTDLYFSAVSKSYAIGVNVPVIENGSVAYVLSFVTSPTRISRVLHRTILPKGGVASVIGRNGIVIARTSNEANSVGHSATPDFLAAISGSTEGIYEARSLEGSSFRGAFTRSSILGWTVALGFGGGEFDAPLWRSLWVFGGGGAVLAICALFLALYYARDIARPMVALAGMAAALGRGEHIPAQHLSLREAEPVADQMRSAAAALEQRAREVGLLNASLNQRASALRVANEELEVANRELRGLSYSTSHVLRAPLRAIDGFSEILLEEHSAGLDSEGKRLVGVLRSSAHELNEQIDGILEFLRLGRDKLSRSEIDMAATVRMALKDLEPITRGRKLKIEVSTLPSAFGDAAMIQRVWINLLDNAVKFTALKAGAKIEVGVLSEAGETVYYVRDNGVGFDMRFVGKLFGVFDRLHGADFPGNGTGLAIVQRIVSRHGGRVWAEGKVGEGATFYFTLPASETVDDQRV